MNCTRQAEAMTTEKKKEMKKEKGEAIYSHWYEIVKNSEFVNYFWCADER